MATASSAIHVFPVRVESSNDGTLGAGTALALRRILFMYAGLTAAALAHPRNRSLASAARGSVPHSVRLRAFLKACVRNLARGSKAKRITIR
jgi:hypothetical protein